MSGAHDDAQHSAVESPVLIHIWLVDPNQEGVAADRLDKMLGAITTEPGFLSARVLESDDRVSIAAIVEMRTAEDRQRLERLPVVRGTLDHLEGTVNLVVRLYNQIAEFNP
jgi:hypothetical protein